MSSTSLGAIALSLVVAAGATTVSLPPAIGCGWLLARHRFRGKTWLETFVLLPLVLPPVVTGLILLRIFGRTTPVGGAFAAVGLPLSFSTAAAVLAAAVVGFPLLVTAVRHAFEAIDPRYEQLARTMGLGRLRTFARISLPLAMPGIAAGTMLAYARALGEFGATVVVAGNIAGETQTIALAVYAALQSPQGDPAIPGLLTASVALSVIAIMGSSRLAHRPTPRERTP